MTDRIKVWIKWKLGAACREVPFWMADEYIVRDLQKELPWVSGPFTVDRN